MHSLASVAGWEHKCIINGCGAGAQVPEREFLFYKTLDTSEVGW